MAIEQLAVFTPIEDRGRADLVAQRLSDAVILGVLRDGDRLPSEADLGQQFGVATVTARDALEVLRRRGLITTRRGRGGGSFVTYTRMLGAEGLDQTRFAETSRADLRDMAIHYAALAVKAAALAATRASDDDVARLHELLDDVDYDDDVEVRRGEAVFRVEVAAIAQSARLVKEEVRLQAEYGPLLWIGVSEPECRAAVRHAHGELTAAIEALDEVTAARVVQDEIDTLVGHALRLKARIDRDRP